MERLAPSARRDAYGSKINRSHSPILAYGVPWLSIMLASLTPLLPIIAPAPILPPFGYLMLLGWRMSRPGLLPMWAGFPLGLFNDLYSGQPLGSGILLFSLTMIALDLLETRFPWRDFWQDWLTASVFIPVYLLASALFSGAPFALDQVYLLVPQLLLSIILFPIVVKMISLLDRLRLTRVKRIG
ncbi:rod shape-determining protein MreD [Aurantiacibacter poecillastricola]|uniref:rod shape-determining protein MreD n=1 Tax=Aurantiacibacter poecillastricola TaxID=3064385 RepID=UPI00273D8A95|nr:rod shape-determining protein MreD [Aurantiacibacter sp. 219JJ12-13]MDP5261967.1 rod shape-determining protein MreD [Aurantiacibacter sp. 219JJ12-13]